MRFLFGLGNSRRRQTSLNVKLFPKAKMRREHSPRTLTRVLIVGVSLALIAGLMFVGVRQSLAFLTDNPLCVIQKVDISEPMFLGVEEILSLAAVSKGDNLLRLPIREVQKRLLEHPNIKEAVVRRVFPHTLRIEIKEREPLAQINAGKNYLVDGEGAVLTWNDKFAQREWALIEGVDLKSKVVENKIQSKELREALQVLGLFRGSILATRMDITKVQLNEPGGYLFGTNKGFALRLGSGLEPQEIKEKLAQLEAVLNDLQKKGIAADTIDFRFKDVVVSPRHTGSRPKTGDKTDKKTER